MPKGKCVADSKLTLWVTVVCAGAGAGAGESVAIAADQCVTLAVSSITRWEAWLELPLLARKCVELFSHCAKVSDAVLQTAVWSCELDKLVRFLLTHVCSLDFVTQLTAQVRAVSFFECLLNCPDIEALVLISALCWFCDMHTNSPDEHFFENIPLVLDVVGRCLQRRPLPAFGGTPAERAAVSRVRALSALPLVSLMLRTHVLNLLPPHDEPPQQ
eukprot:TRINITY_DN3685_c0_g1_i5.p2 TRINITY_DN3685_c0_g1~~TRINITY_DN3685_c0_g1_i5.p2  ORF type:complete len:216 (-),score=45.24 TRINITY_DN3685_c0_g1_i5:51-698(-)